jgi:hypothetical protein
MVARIVPYYDAKPCSILDYFIGGAPNRFYD